MLKALYWEFTNYSTDPDGSFPPPDTYQEQLALFAEKKDRFKGFPYTLRTNLKVSELESEDSTELGYVDTRTYRIVVYTSGTIMFVKRLSNGS